MSRASTQYVALLRAVNVGGTGKLPMTELTAMCARAGFHHARTYIASGNALFTSDRSESAVKRALEQELAGFFGKPMPVLVRTAVELQGIVDANPFPDEPTSSTVAIFLDDPPPADALDDVTGRAGEQLALGRREIYVAYGAGMGRSKLRIRAAHEGTARNMNTVATLARLAAELPTR